MDSPTEKSSPAGLPPPLHEQRTVITARSSEMSSQERSQEAESFSWTTPLVGQRLGHFQLEGVVGGGGMGAVFRATDMLLNRVVALKVMAPDLAAVEENRRRFENEAQSAARLDHENIARVHFNGEDRGWHYIVFEFVHGKNIRDLIVERGPLPLAEALSYLFQAALALAHAHRQQVIHRDIKPSNVIVTAEGKVKLVDMGLARLHVPSDSDDLTASGMTLGTFDYISPEQARDPRAADVRSDLYSLGCTFYFMLTGQPPFSEGTVLQKLLSHQHETPPDPRELRAELPEEISGLTQRMLAKLPEERFADPRELIYRIQQLAKSWELDLGDVVPVRSLEYEPTLLSPGRSFTPWLAPLGTLVLMVLGLEWYWAWSDPTPIQAFTARLRTVVDGRPVPGLPSDGSKNDLPGATPEIVAPDTQPVEESTSSNPGRVEATSATPTVPSANGPSLGEVNGNPHSQGEGNAPAVFSGSDDSVSRGGGNSDIPATNSGTFPVPPVAATVTDRDAMEVRKYYSVHDAFQNAADGSVIELQFSGRRDMYPVDLGNRRLTIRGSSNENSILVFRPKLGNPMVYPDDMVHLRGGDIRWENVHFEFMLPEVEGFTARKWSLFLLADEGQLRFQRCTFTLLQPRREQEAFGPSACLLEIGQERNGDDDPVPASMVIPEPRRATIDMQDCIVRGDGTLLRADMAATFRLVWSNGLATLSRRLLETSSGERWTRSGSYSRIELSHLTAYLGQGFARLEDDGETLNRSSIEVEARDSIFLTTYLRPFLETTATASAGEDSPVWEMLPWRGSRVYFDGFDVFHQSGNGSSATPLLLSTWLERQSAAEQAAMPSDAWRRPITSLPAWHGLTPEDFLVEPSAFALTAFEPGSGNPPGFVAAALPDPPNSEGLHLSPQRILAP